MSRRHPNRRIRARLHGERGFTILETVIALMVVFASLTALTYTVSNGFRYTGYGRDRIQASGIANRIMEDIRGLAYAKITNGIPTSELAADSRAANCSGTFRFESCAGEKIVSSTFDAAYTAAWLLPHTGNLAVGNLDVTYSTYITNDTPTTTPYRVTVIVQWTNGAIPNAPNNSVRLQSLFWSPDGCVSSITHPFAAPCQPFFYGQVDAPQATMSVTGQLYDFAIDFDRLAVTLPGITATTQEEQTAQLNATTTLSGITFTNSAGDEEVGDQRTASDADDQVDTAAPAIAGGTSTNVSALTLSRLATGGSGQQVGLRANIAAGDLEGRSASVDATVSDAYACPTMGTRETDLLPCSGAHVRQVGTITVEVLHAQLLAALGPANLLRVVAPATGTTAWIDRDVGGTNEDGLLDAHADRTLGTIQLGGFPSAGMTAPTGMSTTRTSDTNYCVGLVAYQDSAQAIAGESTATAPSASIAAGTFFYYNGLNYSNKLATDASLDTQTVTCAKTQLVGASSVTWRVTVASGGLRHATTTTAQTLDPANGNIRWDVTAATHPIEITLRYELIVDGVAQINLLSTFDPGDLLAHGIYEPPPATQGA
ncbi:MAG: type IV pilus modification PilV family protein [Actinomycetota bacterium]